MSVIQQYHSSYLVWCEPVIYKHENHNHDFHHHYHENILPGPTTTSSTSINSSQYS